MGESTEETELLSSTQLLLGGGQPVEGTLGRDEAQHEAEIQISRSLLPSEGWRGQCSNQLC